MIRERINELYEIIGEADKELLSLRKSCEHKTWKKGNYGWAPAHFQEGAICNECDEFLGDFKIFSDWFNDMNDGYDRWQIAMKGQKMPHEKIKIDIQFSDISLYTKKEFVNELNKFDIFVPKIMEKYFKSWIKSQ